MSTFPVKDTANVGSPDLWPADETIVHCGWRIVKYRGMFCPLICKKGGGSTSKELTYPKSASLSRGFVCSQEGI